MKETLTKHLTPTTLLRMFGEAAQLATKLGWNGKFLDGPLVSGSAPRMDHNETTITISWGEPQTGMTYLATYYPIQFKELDRIKQITSQMN
ncbi:MAG: hypothetical protein HQL80_11515 [Magnetococcales bacterium]|nr:hypothetical protein [Magnetococcales bacterium]